MTVDGTVEHIIIYVTQFQKLGEGKPHCRSARQRCSAAAARMSQTFMMAATLGLERDSAPGVTDAPHLPAAARNVCGAGAIVDRGGRPPGNDHYAKSGWEVSTWGRWRERHWK